MTMFKGKLLLVKIGDGQDPENFSTIGGLRATNISLQHEVQDSSHVESGAWRKLLSGAGARSATISGVGVFTDAAAERDVRAAALAGTTHNFEIYFGDGDKLTGSFQVVQYETDGEYEGLEQFSITLESAGTITLVEA